MTRVVANNNGNTTPYMDRLSHAVIKETSKNLRHYLDVKRRENAFVLNPNSSAFDPTPNRARFIYGTTKEYPPSYGSSYSDNDIKVYMRSFQQQQKQTYSTKHNPEKQICREELNFHMRTNKSLSRENQKFAELRLRPHTRSSSTCNLRDLRRETPKSAFKLSHHQQNQLIDDTANILASMIKTRRSFYGTTLLPPQTSHTYDSRHTNPTPRLEHEQHNVQPGLPALPRTSIASEASTNEKPKRKTKNALEKAISIMRKAEPLTKGILCEYKVTVVTGNCNGASTDAPIRIKFYGTNGYTTFLDLVDSETHRVPFTKDQTDVFTIQTYHVGHLAGITIGHDRKDIRSGWFLNKISIHDPIREVTSDIPCNAWLSNQSNDQKTMRDFPVNSMISHKKQINSNEFLEHRQDFDGQLDQTSTTSDTTNRSQNDRPTKHKRTKKYRKQHRVSVDSTAVAKKSTALSAITNHLSEPPPATTVESHYDQNEFTSPSPKPTRRSRSPVISSSSSSDTEIAVIRSHSSSSSTTDDTFKNPSVNQDRPSARIEKRHSPIYQSPELPSARIEKRHSPISHLPERSSARIEKRHSPISQLPERPSARIEKPHSLVSRSPDRPIKRQDETNEHDAFAFFD